MIVKGREGLETGISRGPCVSHRRKYSLVLLYWKFFARMATGYMSVVVLLWVSLRVSFTKSPSYYNQVYGSSLNPYPIMPISLYFLQLLWWHVPPKSWLGRQSSATRLTSNSFAPLLFPPLIWSPFWQRYYNAIVQFFEGTTQCVGDRLLNELVKLASPIDKQDCNKSKVAQQMIGSMPFPCKLFGVTKAFNSKTMFCRHASSL